MVITHKEIARPRVSTVTNGVIPGASKKARGSKRYCTCIYYVALRYSVLPLFYILISVYIHQINWLLIWDKSH